MNLLDVVNNIKNTFSSALSSLQQRSAQGEQNFQQYQQNSPVTQTANQILSPVVNTIIDGPRALGRSFSAVDPFMNPQVRDILAKGNFAVPQNQMGVMSAINNYAQVLKSGAATLGLATAPATAVISGLINPVFQAGTQLATQAIKGQPLKVDVNVPQSIGKGIEFGAELGTVSKMAGGILDPILQKINPAELSNINSYLNIARNTTDPAIQSQVLQLAAKRIIQNVGASAITGAVGFGALGGIQPANTIQERLTNILHQGLMGGIFGAATKGAGFAGSAAMNTLANTNAQDLPIGNQAKPIGGNEAIDKAQMANDASTSNKISPDELNTQMNENAPNTGNNQDLAPQDNSVKSPVNTNEVAPPNNGDITNTPGMKPRGFLQTVENTPGQNPDVTQAAKDINPQDYPVLPNDVSKAAANARIEADPQAAQDFVLSDAPASAEKAATGQLLMQKYAENINQGTNYEDFKAITDKLSSDATSQGQAIQILSNWSKLSPQAILNVANNAADEIGKSLPDEFQKQIIDRASTIQQMADGSPEKIQATQDLLKDVADQLPNTAGEYLRSFRFFNMLSGPVTLGRIGYSGLFNTLITRPADLFFEAPIQAVHAGLDSSFERTVYFSDIPAYYKNILLGLPNAWDAAIESFKNGQTDQAFNTDNSGEATIQGLRKANLPGVLQIPGKLHGAIYNFFNSLIAGGEQARLLENGVDPTDAAQQGNDLADKLTLRSQLGVNDATPKAVQAVDSIGRMVQKISDLPVLGEAQSWIAPFMRVSTNFAKLGVEHSLLSLPDSLANTIQGVPGADAYLASSFFGSVLTGLSAMLAARGKITLSAPTDPKANELFYASGAKPNSVRIGNNWYPLQYFGPLGISMMLPAAFKDAVSGVNAPKTALGQFESGLSDVMKSIVAATPLPTLTGFFNFVNGDTSVNPDTLFADLSSQLIPAEAMLRYVSQMMDPIYRKAKTFNERIQSGIPGLTQSLPAYTTPTGQPETRNLSNFIAPYGIGVADQQYEGPLQFRQQQLNSNAVISQSNKQGEIRGGKQVADQIWTLPDGTFAYQVGQEFKQASSQMKAQQAIDKYNFSNSDKTSMYANGLYYTKDVNGNIHVSLNPPKVKGLKAAKSKTTKLAKAKMGKITPIKLASTSIKSLTSTKLPTTKLTAGKLPTFGSTLTSKSLASAIKPVSLKKTSSSGKSSVVKTGVSLV